MKKLLSIFMALVLVFTLAVPSFAADTGSITITNATIDKEYKLYKVFDATIKKDAYGNTEAVAYSIETTSQFFNDLFGTGGTGFTFFNYDSVTGAVTKKADAVDTEVIEYLTNLIKNGSYTPVDTKTASTAEVKFSDIPYGYHVILSSLGAAVTINSNAPDVEVIDKNQSPANDFVKKIETGVDAHGNPIYEDITSIGIGDIVKYNISFTATNYDGTNKIKYYQIEDNKGDAIWVEFEDIHVFVGGTELYKGYYLNHGDPSLNTDGWEYLGNWGSTVKHRDNADWYLVHLGYDQFRVIIPWLENHTLTDVTDSGGNVVSHDITYPADADSKFGSPVDVKITYTATIEPETGIIGGGAITDLINTATGSWIGEGYTDTTPPDSTTVEVYGIGLTKTDAATGAHLAGAEFRIYSDEACTKPVYVIPTDVEGIYILDSLNTPGDDVSGTNRVTTREKYDAYLADYLGADYKTSGKQDNILVTPVNGKLAVLGLKAGTYYLKEVKAPAGYNALTTAIEIKAGDGTKSFTIFADDTGKVADIVTTDGIHKEVTYQLTSTTVQNSKGVELPSTGGEGAMMLFTIGSLVTIGFAILLITQKKMSVYKD